MRIVGLFLLLFISAPSIGQQLLMSPDEYLSSNSGTVKVIGTVGDKTVCFVETADAFKLLWYDSAMRKLAVSQLDFLERGAFDFKFYPSKDGVNIFYQRKKRKDIRLWAVKVMPIDKDTVTPVIIDSLALDGAWDKKQFRFYNTGRNDRWAYGLSDYNNSNNRLSVQVKVLDSQFNIIQQANEQMTDVVYHDLLDIVIDKNDGIHVLYGEPTKRGMQLQNMIIGSQRANVRTMKFSALDMNGFTIGDGRLVLNEQNGLLYLGGLLYKNDFTTLAALGGFVYDPTQQEWTTTNITDIYGANGIQQGLLTNMRMKNLMLKKDGSYSIVMEKTFQETFQRNRSIGFVSPGIGMASSSYEIYHNDEIVVIDISPAGDLQWYETLIKEQETSDANERYHSFGMLQSALGNVFLFSDQTNKNSRFINGFLSNTGELRLKQFTGKGAESLSESGMMLRNAMQTQANEIVFPVVKRGTLSFAKIVF